MQLQRCEAKGQQEEDRAEQQETRAGGGGQEVEHSRRRSANGGGIKPSANAHSGDEDSVQDTRKGGGQLGADRSATDAGRKRGPQDHDHDVHVHGESDDEGERQKTKHNKSLAERGRALVKCAAANDDEDLGVFLDVKAHDTKAHRLVLETVAPVDSSCAPQPKDAGKKEKTFAWMDSGDEEDQEDLPKEDATRAEKKLDELEEADSEHEEEEASVAATIEALDSVQSFGRMMRLAPALQNKLRSGTMGVVDVMAACRALARTKFFDGDILQDLYVVLRKLLQAGSLDVSQTDDAIQCFRTLNAYDREFFSAVAKAFKCKTQEMQAMLRNAWLDAFKSFGHKVEGDFLQLLEVPPLLANNPGYRRVRCWHYSRGACALEGVCTFSHDPRAPLSLADAGNEDWWRSKPLVMTQNQKTLGHGVYGLSSSTDSRSSPAAPTGWLIAMAPGLAPPGSA